MGSITCLDVRKRAGVIVVLGFCHHRGIDWIPFYCVWDVQLGELSRPIESPQFMRLRPDFVDGY